MNNQPIMPEFFAIHNVAAPIYIGFILLELALIYIFHLRGKYETKDSFASLAMGTGSVISELLLGAVTTAFIYLFLLQFYQFAPVKWEYSIWSFAACFILNDFKYYWSHRFSHTIRWGWVSHVVHHSSKHFNLTTALRQPWFSFTKGFFLLGIPLALLGFHPALIAFTMSINLVYQFFIHTEAVDKLHPWIEAVFNTPSHHRIHHCRNPQFLDANYAGVFIVWDRMFGTFIAEPKDAMRHGELDYGIVKDIESYNPLYIAMHEYIAMAKDFFQTDVSFKTRLAYLFAPPGWSHDGSRKSSKQLKAEYRTGLMKLESKTDPLRSFGPPPLSKGGVSAKNKARSDP